MLVDCSERKYPLTVDERVEGHETCQKMRCVSFLEGSHQLVVSAAVSCESGCSAFADQPKCTARTPCCTNVLGVLVLRRFYWVLCSERARSTLRAWRRRSLRLRPCGVWCCRACRCLSGLLTVRRRRACKRRMSPSAMCSGA